MSDYTPTTEQVRDAVAYDGDFYESNGDWIVLRDDIAACFDRWLAAHDAEVHQRGREAAAKAVEADIRGNNAVYDLGDTHIEGIIAAARGEGDQK